MLFTRLFSWVSLAAAAVHAQTSSVDTYISTEGPIAKAGLLANIGPSGSQSKGAKAGVVVASPSENDPDYLYTWVRDSSLVFKVLIDQFTSGQDTTLRPLIDAFVVAESTLQQTPNPSGTIQTGGLAEPKFNIDLTAFTGSWGRPQRDGPALRSTALISYANWLIDNGNQTWVTKTLWPAIQLDLDYLTNNWNQSTFDLWEEINSSSFFTTAVQHRALREGVALASRLGQTSLVSGYSTQADNVLCFLQSFWNPTQGYITANTGGGRSGKDSNTVLASIHTFDPEAGCDAATFQPCSDKALSNLQVYVDSFRPLWAINAGFPNTAAIAVGRYPEDVYYNGNPWYLCTFAVAEQLYDALYVWNQQGTLQVTSTSLPFFQRFSSSVTTGTYNKSTTTYQTLTTAIKTFADGFIAENAKYTPTRGDLSEQYDKVSGTPLSAVDLTWSYASALTAFNARKGVNSPSWGAKGVTVPSVCKPNAGPQVQVTFNIQATTVWGESIYLTGAIPALSNWSPDTALALSSTNYPTWSVTVTLPANTVIQYKYIRKNNGAVTWESDPNDQITTPASGTFTVNDSWR